MKSVKDSRSGEDRVRWESKPSTVGVLQHLMRVLPCLVVHLAQLAATRTSL